MAELLRCAVAASSPAMPSSYEAIRMPPASGADQALRRDPPRAHSRALASPEPTKPGAVQRRLVT